MKKSISIVIFSAIAILLVFLVVYFGRYNSVRTFDFNGYVFTSENVTDNLINGEATTGEKVDYSKVKSDDSLYEGRGKYYIGDKKKVTINMDYPLVSSDSNTLLILNDNSKLIDEKFRKVDSYSNSFVSDNSLYNESDYEKVDDSCYILIELNNSIFVNLSEITIEDVKTQTIPLNSFISFYDNGLRYYYMKNGKYFYNEIEGLDNNILKINDMEIRYNDFLEKIGLLIPSDDLDSKVISVASEIKDTVKDGEGEGDGDGSGDGSDGEIEIDDGEREYVKPVVSFSDPSTGTYSFKGILNISDPTSQIVKYPTFEFWDGRNLYIRKTFGTSGAISVSGLFPNREYYVVAYYNYKNEKGQEVKSEISKFTITTDNMDNLDVLTINMDEIIPESNCATLKNLRFENSQGSEVLKGIKKIIVNVDNNSFTLSNSLVSKLSKLDRQDFTTSKSLKSSTKYNVTFEVYDVAGNRLRVNDTNFSFRTTKKVPSGTISINNKDITQVSIHFNIDNPDNINIANMYYELYDSQGILVKRESIDSYDVVFKKLDANEVYNIFLYGSYDLEDGHGIMKNQQLIKGKFTTDPLSTLGYLRLNVNNIVSGPDSVSYDFKISDEVKPQLRELISDVSFNLRNSSDDSIVGRVVLTDEQLSQFLRGETISLVSENLAPNQVYYFDFHSYARLGNNDYEIKTVSNVKELKTFKRDAEVDVINKFVTERIIDFDVKVKDLDYAIESGRVFLEVRDATGSLIHYDELGINGDYQHINIDKLKKNENYTFSYIVEEYNIGYNNLTFETNYTIFEEKIFTEEGLYGTVEIESLLKQPTTHNLFDLSNNSRWKSGGAADVPRRKSNIDDDTLTLGAKNGYRTYSYYLPEYKNKTVTISFLVKYADNNHKPLYVCDNGSNNCKSYKVGNFSDDSWTAYSKTFKINNGNPYVSFTIVEDSGQNNITTVVIKNLQIEEGSTATEYMRYHEKENYMGSFVVNLTDKNHEIDRSKFYYYLRFYEDGLLKDTIQFDFNDSYSVIDQLYSHEIVPYKEVDVRLSIKKKVSTTGIVDDQIDSDGYRFYDLANVVFTSDEEIRTIRTYEDLLAIHVSGKYLVAEDISFRDKTGAVGTAFNGTIDFQGHRVDLDSHYMRNGNYYNSANYIFSTLNRNGIIKNVDFHYHFDGPARSNIYGFVSNNSGLIENIKVTVDREYYYPEGEEEKGNVSVSFITNSNNGRIRNFVVKLEDPLLIERRCGLVAYNNYGDIFNGYLYGADIESHYKHLYKEQKYIGGVAAYTANYSNIQNVFSLININIGEDQTTMSYHCEVGNIIGYSGRTILRNVYTYSNGKNRRFDVDANVYGGNVNGYNVFYASADEYRGNFSNRIAPNAIRNISFQEMLNEDNAFDVFNLVRYGYYPHLKWPDNMPNQDYILLPNENDGKIDFLNMYDKVENTDGTVEATLEFANPGYDTIVALSFSNGLKCQILSQENAANKSTLKVVFSDPTTYTSVYSLVKIDSLSSFNTPSSRIYSTNERKIYVNMYKNINNMNEFLAIGTSQNYRLQTDLNFNNIDLTAKRFITSFSGKLDGNNHTISNISVTNRNFLNTLSSNAMIKNLFVENYHKYGNSAYGGFIGQVSANATIDNVHLTDVYVADSNAYIGGFFGYSSNASISNSSITNVKIYETSDVDLTLTNKRYGGFGGHTSGSIIKNCYAQDVDIELDSSVPTNGIGGFVGRQDSGYIQDGYVTGQINTNQQEVGGVVGYNQGYIERFISNVNIFTKKDYLGGIAGYSTTDAITGTLVLGSIYTVRDASNLNRTIGNRTSTYSNYAWSDQFLNGLNTSEISGDILVNYDDLKSSVTYSSFIGKEFDLSNLVLENNHNIIPKLKYTSSDKLLPNQKDNEYYLDSFNVKNIEFDKGINNATIRITLNNPDGFEVKNISIDGLRIIRVNNNFNLDGETIYEVYVAPERYYDSYMINNITYVKNSKDVSINPAVRIEMTFYKDIATFEDWQAMSTKYYENYRLVGDIDFAGKTNIKTNVLINRLEGTGENGHTLKNIEITDTGLINTITGNINNINFENVKINYSGRNQYVGIIRIINGTIRDVNFKDIEIQSNVNYTGSIAYNLASDVRNINLSGYFYVKGAQYVGGFIGYSKATDIMDVTMIASDKGSTKSMVRATSSYAGGLIGYGENSSTSYRFRVENIDVTGVNSVGGAFGYGPCNTLTVKNVNATGNNYVGGVAGQAGSISNVDFHGTSNARLTITGTGNYVGSVFGSGGGSNIKTSYIDVKGTNYVGGVSGNGGITNGHADNITVEGNNYVGGISGNGSGNHAYPTHVTIKGNSYVGGIVGSGGVSNSGIDDTSTMTATGNYVGGITGMSSNSTIQNNYVHNFRVEGNKYVGGIAGANTGGSTNQMMYNITNATVVAREDYAGGLYGYINNKEEYKNELYYRVFLYRNVVAGSTITSNGSYAGAIAAVIDNHTPYPGRFYQNFIAANVNTSYSSENPEEDLYKFYIGNDDGDYTFTSYITSMRAYENSTYNGVRLSSIKSTFEELSQSEEDSTIVNFAKDLKMYKASELRNINVFKDILVSTFNFTRVESGNYPYLTATYDGVALHYFDLPSTDEDIYSSSGNSGYSLPSLMSYACDVDKINLEFSEVSDGVSFEVGDEVYNLDKLTYTFNYDYTNDFSVTVYNSNSSQKYNFNAEDLSKETSVIGNDYYFLNDGNIITNNPSSIANINKDGINFRRLLEEKNQNTDSNKYMNIYQDKILLSNHNIYDITKKAVMYNSFDNLSLADDTSLYSFKYGNNTIDTYYNYSIVNGEVITKQVFVSNDSIEVIDSTLNNVKDSVIVDNYNNSNYLIYLGTDGRLYSLKDNIKFPNRFVNSGIKSIDTDIYGDSDIVFVLYTNNDYIVFNYLTGEVLSKSFSNKDLVSYFTTHFNNSNVVNKKIDSYNDSLALIEKLNNKGVDDVLGNSRTKEKTSLDNYVSVYNPVTEKYEVYKLPDTSDNNMYYDNSGLDDILSNASVTSEINNNIKLTNYYMSENTRRSTIIISVMAIIIAIITGIGLSILLLKRNLKKAE